MSSILAPRTLAGSTKTNPLGLAARYKASSRLLVPRLIYKAIHFAPSAFRLNSPKTSSYMLSIVNLVVEPGREGTGLPLVVPTLGPAGGAERAVGEEELYVN